MKKSNIMKLLAVMLIAGLMAAVGAVAGDISITGTVKNTDNGMMIATDDGTFYNVMGVDLTAMIGKTIKATGTVNEEDDDATGNKVIIVNSVEPVQK